MTAFSDPWRGDGVFKAWQFASFTFLLALRKRWHLYAIRPPAKPGYWRVYIGPLEIEVSKC